MSVRHPGPRPPDFEFPFAAAQVALSAIEDLIDALASTGGEHEAAASGAAHGFEGRSREAFERWLADALEDLRGDRAQLDADADHLRTLLATADHRRTTNHRQIAAWQRDVTSYQADQREQQRRSDVR